MSDVDRHSGADSIRVMCPLFQAGEGGSTPTSALQLWVGKVDFELAVALNSKWHSRLPRYGRGFIKKQSDLCFGAEFDGRLFAVAIWSNPVARELPQKTWLELRRLAIGPDSPKNTASRMLRIMALLISRQRGRIERLISYHDSESHAGTIYRAAGWVVAKDAGTAKHREWSCPSRPRPDVQSGAPKVRWEKVITRAA